MKKILVGIVIAALLATGTIFVTAQTFGDQTGLDAVFSEDNSKGVRGKFFQQILDRVADKLDLTTEQRAEIREILEDAAPRVAPLVMQAKATREQLKPLGRDGVYNEAQVQQLATRQAANVRALIVEKEKVKAEIFAVLTPAQRAQANEMQEQFEQKIRQRIGQRIGMNF